MLQDSEACIFFCAVAVHAIVENEPAMVLDLILASYMYTVPTDGCGQDDFQCTQVEVFCKKPKQVADGMEYTCPDFLFDNNTRVVKHGLENQYGE
eukprot:g37297.t1